MQRWTAFSPVDASKENMFLYLTCVIQVHRPPSNPWLPRYLRGYSILPRKSRRSSGVHHYTSLSINGPPFSVKLTWECSGKTWPCLIICCTHILPTSYLVLKLLRYLLFAPGQREIPSGCLIKLEKVIAGILSIASWRSFAIVLVNVECLL